MITTALAVVAVLGAMVGGLVVVENAMRPRPPSVLESWASARSVERDGEVYRTIIDGIPVSLALDGVLVASAVYPVGGGPAFELRSPGFEITRRGALRSTVYVHDAEGLVQAVHRRYRKRGLATDALERVVAAIRKHVDGPIAAPSFVSDGRVVRVSIAASSRPADVDRLAALAVSIASFDLAPLVAIAKDVSSVVEIGSDGIAFVALSGRASIRITLCPSEPGSQSLGTAVSGTLDRDDPDLVREPVEAAASSDAGRVRGETATEALRALVDLREARVSLRPRGASVQFVGHPPIDRLRRAADALEALLSPGSQSAFR